MKLKLFSIILSLIFMVQILPVKEVAQLLTSGQLTEDIHDTGAKKQNPNEEVHKKLFFYATPAPSSSSSLLKEMPGKFISDDAIINNLYQLILIQPPDLT